MASAKVFETAFRINAQFVGQAGIAKAQNALTRLGKHASATAARMRSTMTATAAGVFGGQALFAAASRAVSALGDAHAKAVEAAAEAQKVEEHLGLTLDRNKKRWGLNEKQVKLQQQAIIAMGDSLAKLGLDGETAVAMFDELTNSVDPRNLANYKKGLADFLISQKGVNASQEDAVALGKDIAKVIEFKMPKALKKFKGVTDAQIEAYSKLETREQRQAWFMRNIAKETGSLEQAMATAEGKIIKRANMLEDLQESWGKPWLVLRQAIGEGLASMIEQIRPHMDRLAEEIGPRLAAIGEQFKAWAKSEEVIKWFDRLGTAIKFVIDHWKELSIAFAAVAGLSAVAVTLGVVALAVTALLSPIGLVVVACGALVAAGVAIYANWDTISAKAVELWTAISAAWDTGVAAVIAYAESMKLGIQNAFSDLYNIITAPFLRAYNDITKWFSTLPSKIWQGLQGGPTGVSEHQGQVGYGQSSSTGQSGSGVPTTEYSKGGKAGPDEMTDKWTERGYSSTGPNLTPGVVAVNEKAHKIGTIFQDQTTGKHYIAADRHGNNNPNVVDVYKDPSAYGKSAQPSLKPVGSIPRGNIPKSAAGMRSYLESLDAGQKGSSLNDMSRGIRQPAANTSNNSTVATMGSTTINVNGAGDPQATASAVAHKLRDRDAEFIAQVKSARRAEGRLGYV